MKTLIPRQLEAHDLLLGRLAALRPRLSIEHHGQAWRIELVSALAAKGDETLIAVEFPECEFLLRIPAASMAGMAAALCGVAPSTLPSALQAAVVIAAAEEIAQSRGGRIWPASIANPSDVHCAFGWVAYLDGNLIARGSIEASPTAWTKLLDSHEWRESRSSAEISQPDLSVPVRMELGQLILPLKEAQALRAGDVLLPDQAIDPERVELVVAGCLYARAVLKEHTVRLETRLRRRPMDTQKYLPQHLEDDEPIPGDAEESGFDPAAEAEPPNLVDDIPVTLSFQLGETDLSLSEVRSLQENSVIELHRPLRRYVSIRSNGLHLADGELVEIEGRLGVQVVAMAQRRS